MAITQKNIWYIHACVGLPTKGKWLQGIRAVDYDTFMGLTENLVTKNLPDSYETQKGHMRKVKKVVISTK